VGQKSPFRLVHRHFVGRFFFPLLVTFPRFFGIEHLSTMGVIHNEGKPIRFSFLLYPISFVNSPCSFLLFSTRGFACVLAPTGSAPPTSALLLKS